MTLDVLSTKTSFMFKKHIFKKAGAAQELFSPALSNNH
jgi:hypothetical protein